MNDSVQAERVQKAMIGVGSVSALAAGTALAAYSAIPYRVVPLMQTNFWSPATMTIVSESPTAERLKSIAKAAGGFSLYGFGAVAVLAGFKAMYDPPYPVELIGRSPPSNKYRTDLKVWGDMIIGFGLANLGTSVLLGKYNIYGIYPALYIGSGCVFGGTVMNLHADNASMWN